MQAQDVYYVIATVYLIQQRHTEKQVVSHSVKKCTVILMNILQEISIETNGTYTVKVYVYIIISNTWFYIPLFLQEA